MAHYERLGISARVLPLKTREDAVRADVIGMVDDASLIFFSGGNPWYLSTVLDETPLWERLRERLLDGLAYAGCSAGVACLTDMTYDSDTQDFDNVFKPGLGYVRNALFAPHWDIVETWIPGAKGYITAATPAGGVLVALDEDTAMVGDGSAWTVHGRQGVHVYRSGSWADHVAGAAFDLALV
jgi:cyanophycinase